MRDAECRLVEDDIGRLHQCFHQLAIAYVAVNQSHRPAPERATKILRPASDHVVDSNNFNAAFVAEQINDVGSDEACAAGDQNALSLELNQDALLLQDLVTKPCELCARLLTASLG